MTTALEHFRERFYISPHQAAQMAANARKMSAAAKQTAEIGLAVAVNGFIAGRWGDGGELAWKGIPLDGVLAFAGYGAALLMDGHYADDLLNLAHGSFAYLLARKSAAWGKASLNMGTHAALAAGPTKTSGYPQTGAGMTAEEMAAWAEHAQRRAA